MNIDDFSLNISKNQSDIIHSLNRTFIDIPGVVLKKKFSIPFYYRISWVAYLNPISKNGIELCFINGNKMSNHDGRLIFGKRKQVGGISFYEPNDLRMDSILDHFHEALILDEL